MVNVSLELKDPKGKEGAGSLARYVHAFNKHSGDDAGGWSASDEGCKCFLVGWLVFKFFFFGAEDKAQVLPMLNVHSCTELHPSPKNTLL